MKIRCTIIICFYLFFNTNISESKEVEKYRINYSSKKQEIQLFLKNKKSLYYQHDKLGKKSFLTNCGTELFNYLIEDIFPAWYGTEWSFNGQTKVPGKGTIACGFFIIHTLQDVGFKIPSKMALQPSENIIKNLINPEDIKRFTKGTDMNDVRNWILSQGDGLYIVGLDIHVGYLIKKKNRITFCHSSYFGPPFMVENEDIIYRSPLTESKYKVIGKILTEEMMQKWIEESEFEIKYDYFRNSN